MKVVAVAGALAALALGAAGIGVAVSIGSSTRAESESTPLIAWMLIPAGTPGELVLRQRRPLYSTSSARPEQTRRQELIYDWEYLRGRVAIVDIMPGQELRKADFRP